jgi:hypothetical protein
LSNNIALKRNNARSVLVKVSHSEKMKWKNPPTKENGAKIAKEFSQ